MIDSAEFLDAAGEAGFDFYTGVPCSFLTPLINRAIADADIRYVGAASEGEAVAIAAGAWLAGRQTVVMFQNSGLGNAVNPLTSLNHPLRIPTLLIVTWRAGPGLRDEPQHALMGEVTPTLLDVIRIPHRSFPNRSAHLAESLSEATRAMRRSSLPFALILQQGMLRDEPLEASGPAARDRPPVVNLIRGGARPARYETLERLLAVLPQNAALIATTGKCGRELFTIDDRPQHLYQVGSMGCASGMGLGVALNVELPVVVIDGDGAALMKLGTLATIGAYAPTNLLHVLLDNGVHDSTGGQPTVSGGVDFAGVARACGYRRAYECDELEGFEHAVREGMRAEGPSFVHVRIRPGSLAKLGRPTIAPHDVARRFRDFLAED